MKNHILILLIFFIKLTNAQINETEKQMLWTTISLSKKINKKVKINYLQLHSVEMNTFKFNFIQPELSFNYKLKKKLTTSISYSPTFSLDGVTGNQLVYHRISGKIKLRTKLIKRIYMSNSFVGEHHFTQRSKWKQRFYYRLDLEYKNNRKLPWKMKPFLSQKLYWYQNGRVLQYYDVAGDKTVLQSPNGLHAYRLKLGLKFYPIKKWNFTIYYLKQKEFNSSFLNTKEINSFNPNTGNIRRSFYDFKVFGLNLNYKL